MYLKNNSITDVIVTAITYVYNISIAAVIRVIKLININNYTYVIIYIKANVIFRVYYRYSFSIYL